MKAFKDRYNETLNARREALKALYAQDVNEVALLLQRMIISPEERVKLMRNKVNEFKVLFSLEGSNIRLKGKKKE